MLFLFIIFFIFSILNIIAVNQNIDYWEQFTANEISVKGKIISVAKKENDYYTYNKIIVKTEKGNILINVDEKLKENLADFI